MFVTIISGLLSGLQLSEGQNPVTFGLVGRDVGAFL